jgi:hypothetical protein
MSSVLLYTTVLRAVNARMTEDGAIADAGKLLYVECGACQHRSRTQEKHDLHYMEFHAGRQCWRSLHA